MSGTARSTTVWDVAALRVSSLNGTDPTPSYARVSSLKDTFGTRAMPINLGTPEDLGLPTSLAAEMGPNVPAPSSQITQRNRRDALDNADTALVLRQDTLAPITHDLEGLSYATIQLRRQRRVVGGTIERQSPYWIPSQALERQDPLIPSIRTDGPSRARIPLYGAEMERSMAKLLRGTLKVRPNRPPASNDDEEELAEDSLATPEARQATLRRLAMQVLPVSAQWTEESERDYIAGEYGWIYAPERGTYSSTYPRFPTTCQRTFSLLLTPVLFASFALLCSTAVSSTQPSLSSLAGSMPQRSKSRGVYSTSRCCICA